MKRSLLLLLVLLIPIMLTACSDEATDITFESKQCPWSKSDPTKTLANPCQFQNFHGRIGRTFGPKSDFYKGLPFTLESLDEDGTPIIRFHQNLVLSGESLAQLSRSNPVPVGTDPVCFRTRTPQAGDDICLKVI